MREHELKTWLEPLRAVASGDKTFEVRKNDRDYRSGDVLLLRLFDPATAAYNERVKPIRVLVTYVLAGGQFGIKHGYCVMSIKRIEEPR